MKKTIITAFSILTFIGLITGGCTSTPKQGRVLRHIAGFERQPDFHPKRCTLTTHQPGSYRSKYRMQSTHQAYNKTLTRGASTLTLRDYGLK